MSEHFCTYFDHRYGPKGLAMWRSLKHHSGSATLHVLCLTDACQHILAALRLPDVHLYSLGALETADPGLLESRANRNLVEYYFTLTPCLPLYILRTHAEIERLTYVDADLFFFADPQSILDEVGDNAIGLIEHRFSEDLADLEKYGRFNVGWLTFRKHPVAFQCLTRWREQCLEWCHDRLEPGRFAEQKYLDDWPDIFDSVHIIQHPGANVAPWNLRRLELSQDRDGPRVNGEAVIFFHAHGFEPKSPGRPRVLSLTTYRIDETPLVLGSIFEPYEQALLEATTEIALPLALAVLSDQSREMVHRLEAFERHVEDLKNQLAFSEADRAARLHVINTLEARLEASEADRAARMNVIHVLRTELDASEADRAARLEVIHRLEAQLGVSERDRAARLDVIQAKQNELEASEADRAARLEVIRAKQSELEASEADRVARLQVVHRLEAQLGAIEAERAAERAVHLAELAEARSRVNLLERSRSWRWTRPFRRALSLLRTTE